MKWKPAIDEWERLSALIRALRLLDADIEKLLRPELQRSQFLVETGVLIRPDGSHHQVPFYTKDSRDALSLPGANPNMKYALDITTDWLRRQGK